MYRNLFFFLAVCVFFFVFLSTSSANDQIVFGPESLQISRLHIHFSNHVFSVDDTGGGNITVTKSTPDKEINGGFVLFNSRYISLGSFFRGDEVSFQKSCSLTARNRMVVFLRGKPGASVSIKVIQAGGTVIQPQVTFSANPETILSGESVSLTWETTDAESVSIDNGIGVMDTSGSTDVSPAETTTYTLMATGPGGSTTATLTVTVNYPPTVNISAGDTSIFTGESTTLSWTSSNADSCVIEPDVGTVGPEGSVSVSPTETTTYTITATGAGSTAVASVEILVNELTAPIIILDEEIITIAQGEGATLSWASVGSTSAYIDNGVGTVSTDGVITVTPEHTTIYTLTVFGTAGTANARIYVYVSGTPSLPSEGTWGYTYKNKTPADATVDAYDEKRFAMVVGEVTDIDGQPIEGVLVHIHGHLEYGTCPTDADGRFSLPVDGGDLMTVVYEREGLITSHRKVHTPWNDFVIAETVTMLSEDSAATTIVFDGDPSTINTHQSTVVADNAGTRSATLVFTGDNQAYLVDENGYDVKNLHSITVRATEYSTPDSMPAKLPATSAFTYCTELAVDGAARVRFENPIVMWVDNFIGFDVGEIVPVGSYDRDRGVWIAEENGVVVRLLDTDSDGIVDALDLDGDDLPDDLDGDGNYADEVKGLGDPNIYIAGNTYWRAEVSHFSPWDGNWPYGPPQDAISPNPDNEPVVDEEDDDEECKSATNSYVQQKSRVFHEDIAIPGTDITLHYSSNRIRDYMRKVSIPLSGATVPDSLQKIIVKMQVAGNDFYQTFDPLPNQVAHFYWDGLDSYGNPVGRTDAAIKIGFVYNFEYNQARREVRRAFAILGDSSSALARIGLSFISWKMRSITLWGYKNAESLIAQGWELSNHHWIDQIKDPYTLHKGSGGTVNHIISDYKLNYLDVRSLVTVLAGNTTQGYSGDGNLAIDAQLINPKGLASDAEGNIYIADSGAHCIRKVDTEGIITTVAGKGTAGYSGDGGLATNAMLNGPRNVTVDAAGNIFIADYGNYRVRKVDTAGIITTVAGNGSPSDISENDNGDEGVATAALINPVDLALDSSGNLYIVDYYYNSMEVEVGVIRRVDCEGYISTLPIYDNLIAPDCPSCPMLKIRGITFDTEDNLYFSDVRYNSVFKMDKSGSSVEVIAGGGNLRGEDGCPATSASLYNPSEIIVDCAGHIYILESSDHIRKVNTSGIITTVAGSGASGLNEQGEPVDDVMLLSNLSGFAIDPAGNLYVSYGANSVVAEIGPLLPSLYLDSVGGKVFPEDSGLGYHMDEWTGLHLKTVDLNTGVVLREFGYDSDQNLLTITDQFGNQTVIQRDAAGTPIAIVSPEGLTTTLTLDINQNLVSIAHPGGSYYDFAYTSGGLMTAEIEPNGNRFEHVFDACGRLSRVLDQEGGNWTYGRSFIDDGSVHVDVATGEGNLTSYIEYNDAAGVYTSIITDPTGADTFYTKSADGMTVSKSLPCGMELGFEYGIDTEYKQKYLTKETQTTPTGLEKVTEISKTYQDTDSDGVSDQITNTIDVNDKRKTVVHSVTTSQKVVTSPEGRTIILNYDPSNLLTLSVSVPGLNQTEYGYDAKGRLTSVTTGSRQVSYTYNATGFVYSTTDPESKTTYFSYDAVGRVTDIKRPDSGILRFLYDANGNTTVLTNPSDINHIHSYNSVNLLDGYQTPISGSYRYLYDADRRLVTTTFPSGKQINNIYTTAQLTQVRTPEGDIDYSYICSDIVGSITKGSQSIAYTYDGSLPKAITLNGTLNQRLDYTYKNDFLLETITYAGATEDYIYDLDNLLTGTGRYTIIRNPQNGLAEAVFGGVLSIGRTFNGCGELDGQTVKVSGKTIVQWALTRDNAGRITQKTETVDGITATYDYTYDSMGRLVTVSKDGILVESYGYDLDGTRTLETNTLKGITSRSLSYSDEDHLLTAGSANYQYDLDGFLTSKTDGSDVTNYRYSLRGELLQVNLPDGSVVTYEHDPLGRRIAKRIDGMIVEKYLWQGMTRLLAVYDGSDNLIQRFEYADGRMPVAMTQGGVTYCLAYDQVGSLRTVTDGSGNVVKRIDYDSFGNILADTNSSFAIPFGFAGGLHDRDTGLVRFGYRDYDPDIGRWTAKDPIGFVGGNTDLFGYVQNDPLNLTDPSGQFLATAAVGAFAGGASGVITGLKTGNTIGAVLGGISGAIVGAAVGAILPQWSGISGEIASGIIAGVWGGGIGGLISSIASPCPTALDVLRSTSSGILTGAIMGAINAPFTHLAKLGAGAEISNTVGETAVAVASESISTSFGIIHAFTSKK